MKCTSIFVLAWVSAGCSSGDPARAEHPAPPQPGQLAVSFDRRQLHLGGNEFVFAVVQFDGSPAPPRIETPLERAKVSLYLHGLEAAPEATSTGRFLRDGPPFDPGNGRKIQANYVASFNVTEGGSGLLEFVLEGRGQERVILAPVVVSE